MRDIPYCTTRAGAHAMVRAIAALREGSLGRSIAVILLGVVLNRRLFAAEQGRLKGTALEPG